MSDEEGKADCGGKGGFARKHLESKKAMESTLLPCTMLLVL